MVSPNLNPNFSFKAILLLGATASGKTALAHQLSDAFMREGKICELVNLDAFQIYQELNIGTAKPSLEEIQKYHYHGVDIFSLDENCDANTFARLAWKACEEIQAKNHIPICVGGSGLYLRAFLHGLNDLPPRDEEVRHKIRTLAEEKGWPACHDWLKEVDPTRASELHPNDKTRIERALEIFLITGKPQSLDHSKKEILKEQNNLFPCFVIHCKRNTEILKSRIKDRVKILFDQGWQEEVIQLTEKYGHTLETFHSMQAIGYKEILTQNHASKKDLIEKISTQTWHYAKKQLTWVAKEKVDLEVSFENEDYFHDVWEKTNHFLFSVR